MAVVKTVERKGVEIMKDSPINPSGTKKYLDRNDGVKGLKIIQQQIREQIKRQHVLKQMGGREY